MKGRRSEQRPSVGHCRQSPSPAQRGQKRQKGRASVPKPYEGRAGCRQVPPGAGPGVLRAWRHSWAGFFVLALLLAAVADAAPREDVWLLVDTASSTLQVMEGDAVRQRYANIAIGRGGVSNNKIRRDGATPLGEFRIVRIATDSRFHRFFGLDYPDSARARRALDDGRIDKALYARIQQAHRRRGQPPQDSVLGGYIGIHGIGRGDPAVHDAFNWTYGCVALTNAQTDALARWVRIGMRVVIRR